MGRKAKKRASAAAGQQPTESIRAADGPGERATDEGAPEGSRVESPTAEAEPSSRQLAAAAPTYVYFKHEDEPTGALNAQAMLRQAAGVAL